MSAWTDATDAQLEYLYAQVPEVDCQRKCADACGPIEGGPAETLRLRRAGIKLMPRQQALQQLLDTGDCVCPALVDGLCSVYERARPMVCRIWGASQAMPCPHGCRPVGGGPLLDHPTTLHLLDAACRVGTPQEPLSVDQYAARLATPQGVATYSKLLAMMRPRADR